MALVSDRIKDTFTNARAQLEGFERKAQERVELLERRAKASLGEVRESIDEVPAQLKGAWETVVTRLRGAFDFASNEDLAKLSARLDELAKKVDKLARSEKIRSAAKERNGNNK